MVSEVPLKGIHLTLKMTSSPVTNNGSFQNYRLTWAITLHRLYELIIVFVYEVCSTLILAATSGGRVTVHHAGVHICVHSRHLYILVVKLFLYTVEYFKTRFVLHGYFLSHLSHGYVDFCKDVWLAVSSMRSLRTKCISL